jgi:hypothetical protein
MMRRWQSMRRIGGRTPQHRMWRSAALTCGALPIGGGAASIAERCDGGSAVYVWDDPMAFLVSQQFLGRANRVLMIGLVGGGLVACALGASIYDVGDWLDMW